jgi:predicted phage terminase large subunit-like protein
MAALQYVDVPSYSALIVRRSFPDLNMPGAIMDKAYEWLSPTDAKPKAGGRIWTFPSGARLTFGYIQYHRDTTHFQSAEFQFIGMDELTYWEERTYTFMFSRLRRPPHRFHDRGDGFCDFRSMSQKLRMVPCGLHASARTHENPRFFRPSVLDGKTTLAHVPLRMRTASNPGGIGHAWVKERFIEPTTRVNDAVFVPGRLEDNPSLDRDEYIKTLGHLDPVDRERMLKGDWDVMTQGGMFNRGWWRVIPAEQVPRQGMRWVRYWDKAATRAGANNDPDWTSGALVGLDSEGMFYVRDIVRFRDTPRGNEMVIAQTAELDGKAVDIWLEQEPGASGVESIDHYRRKVLVGYSVHADRKSGAKDSKPRRAAPLSSAAEAGNVFVVRARWNRDFMDEAELFPTEAATHDDQIDSVSGAYHALTVKRTRLVRP